MRRASAGAERAGSLPAAAAPACGTGEPAPLRRTHQHQHQALRNARRPLHPTLATRAQRRGGGVAGAVPVPSRHTRGRVSSGARRPEPSGGGRSALPCHDATWVLQGQLKLAAARVHSWGRCDLAHLASQKPARRRPAPACAARGGRARETMRHASAKGLARVCLACAPPGSSLVSPHTAPSRTTGPRVARSTTRALFYGVAPTARGRHSLGVAASYLGPSLVTCAWQYPDRAPSARPRHGAQRPGQALNPAGPPLHPAMGCAPSTEVRAGRA